MDCIYLRFNQYGLIWAEHIQPNWICKILQLSSSLPEGQDFWNFQQRPQAAALRSKGKGAGGLGASISIDPGLMGHQHEIGLGDEPETPHRFYQRKRPLCQVDRAAPGGSTGSRNRGIT